MSLGVGRVFRLYENYIRYRYILKIMFRKKIRIASICCIASIEWNFDVGNAVWYISTVGIMYVLNFNSII